MYSILSVISYHADECSSGKACSGVVVRPWCVTRGFKVMIVEWSCSISRTVSRVTYEGRGVMCVIWERLFMVTCHCQSILVVSLVPLVAGCCRTRKGQ